MIGSWAMKARVEENLGVALAPGFFDKAEQYARRKLDLCNERAGRKYGEDGYGDEYLVLLTADTVREMAFSEYTMIRSAEIIDGRKVAKIRESLLLARSPKRWLQSSDVLGTKPILVILYHVQADTRNGIYRSTHLNF